MSMKELVLIAGANGTGKTTFANAFLKEHAYEYLNADEIAKKIKPENLSEARISAGKEFFKLLEKNIKQENNLLLETTLSGKYIQAFIPKCKQEGYKISIIYIFLDSPETCIERIKERVLKGGHYIAPEEVTRRYYRSKANFWNIYKNMADNWYVVYNAEDSFKEIAIGKEGGYFVSNLEYFTKFTKDIK